MNRFPTWIEFSLYDPYGDVEEIFWENLHIVCKDSIIAHDTNKTIKERVDATDRICEAAYRLSDLFDYTVDKKK